MNNLANKYIEMGIKFLEEQYGQYEGLNTIIEIEEQLENPKLFIAQLASDIMLDDKILKSYCFSDKENLIYIEYKYQ